MGCKKPNLGSCQCEPFMDGSFVITHPVTSALLIDFSPLSFCFFILILHFLWLFAFRSEQAGHLISGSGWSRNLCLALSDKFRHVQTCPWVSQKVDFAKARTTTLPHPSHWVLCSKLLDISPCFWNFTIYTESVPLIYPVSSCWYLSWTSKCRTAIKAPGHRHEQIKMFGDCLLFSCDLHIFLGLRNLRWLGPWAPSFLGPVVRHMAMLQIRKLDMQERPHPC